MIWALIFVFIGLFSVSLIYFELTGPVTQVMLSFQTNGAPEWFISFVLRCYHGGFIILVLGLLLFGILYGLRTENDTYQ